MVLPYPPTGLTATPNNNQVALTWYPATWATNYNVKRSTTSGTGFVTLPAGANVGATNFTDLTAANGTTYYYVVSGVGTNGQGANSAQVSATPIAPPTASAITSITPGNSQISLSWTPVTGAATYNVKRSLTSGGEATIASVTGTSYLDSPLINGTTYYYEVSAVNISGESANSGEASSAPVAPPASAPVITSATPGNNQITLVWTAVSGATSYNVKSSTTPGGETLLINVAGTSYVDTSAVNGVQTYYVVSAQNAGGQGPNSTEVSATAQAPVVGTPRFTGSTLSGNTLSIYGSGTPGATFGLFGGTNVQVTINNSVLVSSGTLDPVTGQCTIPVTISTTNAAMYFLLVSPYP